VIGLVPDQPPGDSCGNAVAKMHEDRGGGMVHLPMRRALNVLSKLNADCRYCAAGPTLPTGNGGTAMLLLPVAFRQSIIPREVTLFPSSAAVNNGIKSARHPQQPCWIATAVISTRGKADQRV